MIAYQKVRLAVVRSWVGGALLFAACADDGSSGLASDASAAVAEDDEDAGDSHESADAGHSAAASDAGSPEITKVAPHDDLGKGDGHDVITIGDSWMSLGTVGIQQSLVKASGQPYRTYGLGGTRLLDEVIPNQYEQAKQDDPDIKTVVMSAGGNDILQNIGILLDCNPLGDSCKMQINMVAERLKALWQEMADDGVEDVILIGYSRAGGSFTPSIEYSAQVITPLCEAAPLHCHAIDSDIVINQMLRDGIHPTDEGYDLLGEAIYDMMINDGMRR
jgi:lysophospholipase L1-like esterase